MKTIFQSTLKFFTEVKFLRVLLLGALFMMISWKGWGQTLTATISEDATVCLNSASPEITFTGQNGTPPFYFYYNINNDGDSLVAYSETTNIATITSPTDEAGIFIYTLTSVTDLNGSVKVTGQVATITVNAIPGAPTAGSNSPICSGTTLNLTSSDITEATYSWTGPNDFSSTLQNPSILNATASAAGTYYVTATVNGCTSIAGTVAVTVNTVPSSAGPITGPSTFIPGTSGVPYSIDPISGATSYIWSYTGTGVSINGSGTNVTLDFSLSATGGLLKVNGVNACGEGVEASLEILPDSKILNLTSIMLQGLYIGSGTMRQAQDETGPQWPVGVADHIKVELHSAASYNTIVYTASDISLSTTGAATIIIPTTYGDSYYITVKHRNHIETTTATPVSFSGGNISYAFNLPSKVYGENMILIDVAANYYAIYGGDSNSDGVADGLDLISVENGALLFTNGYVLEDLNGDGIVDALDLIMVENNALNFVTVILP